MVRRLALVLLVMALVAGCGGGDAEPTASSAGADGPASAQEEVAEPTGEGDDEPAVATRALFADIADDEPGCTVAVVADDELVFAEAYGAASLDPLVPFEADTVVDIASTSKQFTAIAAGMLILDGTIDAEDPVAIIDAELPAWAEEVTIADLIVHTSGIPDYISLLADGGVDDTDPADQADALAALREVDLDADPGEVFDYSNSNYLLLAEVVASADGRDLPTFLEDEVFGPLGMDATMSFPAPSPGLAVSYELDADDEWQVADSAWTQIGDGAVRTTPSEVARFGATYWRDEGVWADLAELRDEIRFETPVGDLQPRHLRVRSRRQHRLLPQRVLVGVRDPVPGRPRDPQRGCGDLQQPRCLGGPRGPRRADPRDLGPLTAPDRCQRQLAG
jgi:CubicO group peptidase (beta-lactamase class C family)